MDKQAFEQTGLVPRSILRTFERFRRQLLPGGENLVIQEFRISRYQVLVSVKCLLTLAILPFFINYIVKCYFLSPLTKYLWNTRQNEIFLNSYQQKRAFFEMQNFEDQIFFDSLLQNQDSDFFNKFQQKTIELAKQYNQESIEDIKFAPHHLGLILAAASSEGVLRIYEAPDTMNLSQWRLGNYHKKLKQYK